MEGAMGENCGDCGVYIETINHTAAELAEVEAERDRLHGEVEALEAERDQLRERGE